MGACIATVKPMNCLACTFLHKAAILVPGLGLNQKINIKPGRCAVKRMLRNIGGTQIMKFTLQLYRTLSVHHEVWLTCKCNVQ